MSWVRIHDGALTHPKIVGLSDHAFRLWVWGLSYCQQHLTDGWIPPAALPAKSKPDALITARLWVYAAQGGFDVHGYLDWNDSRDTVQKKRDSLKARVTRYRRSDTERARNASAPSGVVNSTDLTPIQNLEGESEGKPEPPVRRDRDYGRIFLHGWQQHALASALGPHADTFGLDVFIEGLSAKADAQGVTFPNRDVRWAWVQAQLTDEVRRRGLPVASPETAPTNKRIAGLMAGGQAFLDRNRRQA